MPVCECCGHRGASLRCGRCRESWYCSKACQLKHWKEGHKTKCVKAAAPAMPSATPPCAERTDAMSVRELKAFLDACGVDHSRCVEKSELRALAKRNASTPSSSRDGGKPRPIRPILDELLGQVSPVDEVRIQREIDVMTAPKMRGLLVECGWPEHELEHSSTGMLRRNVHSVASHALPLLRKQGEASFCTQEVPRPRARAPGAAALGDCAICLCPILKPLKMMCGHSFCSECIEGMRAHGARDSQLCPLCREPSEWWFCARLVSPSLPP